jgi:HAD superfamily phosphoserine phosphatase-like hydrolase
MPLPKIKAAIMDWDDTITDKDTIQLVAEAAYITKPDFHKPWDYYSGVYYSKYKQFIEDFGEKQSIEDEVRYQAAVKSVEMSSVNEYVSHELFKGVKLDTLKQQALKVEIKHGFFEVFQQLYERGIPVFILSCNWTSLIMKKMFEDEGFVANDRFKFITNEFKHTDGELTGTVDDIRCIRTGTDKLKQLKLIYEELKEFGIEDSVYYFGDSCTDILPMLEVDYGMVLDNGSALKTLSKLGIAYDDGLRGDAKIKHIKKWSEINELL